VKIDKRIDQGIGMTSAEVEKYNQLAFFGAEEFLENTRIQIKTLLKILVLWSFWSWFLFCLYGCFNSRDYY
jgi:hypothetical protein